MRCNNVVPNKEIPGVLATASYSSLDVLSLELGNDLLIISFVVAHEIIPFTIMQY